MSSDFLLNQRYLINQDENQRHLKSHSQLLNQYIQNHSLNVSNSNYTQKSVMSNDSAFQSYGMGAGRESLRFSNIPEDMYSNSPSPLQTIKETEEKYNRTQSYRQNISYPNSEIQFQGGDFNNDKLESFRSPLKFEPVSLQASNQSSNANLGQEDQVMNEVDSIFDKLQSKYSNNDFPLQQMVGYVINEGDQEDFYNDQEYLQKRTSQQADDYLSNMKEDYDEIDILLEKCKRKLSQGADQQVASTSKNNWEIQEPKKAEQVNLPTISSVSDQSNMNSLLRQIGTKDSSQKTILETEIDKMRGKVQGQNDVLKDYNEVVDNISQYKVQQMNKDIMKKEDKNLEEGSNNKLAKTNSSKGSNTNSVFQQDKIPPKSSLSQQNDRESNDFSFKVNSNSINVSMNSSASESLDNSKLRKEQNLNPKLGNFQGNIKQLKEMYHNSNLEDSPKQQEEAIQPYFQQTFNPQEFKQKEISPERTDYHSQNNVNLNMTNHKKFELTDLQSDIFEVTPSRNGQDDINHVDLEYSDRHSKMTNKNYAQPDSNTHFENQQINFDAVTSLSVSQSIDQKIPQKTGQEIFIVTQFTPDKSEGNFSHLNEKDSKVFGKNQSQTVNLEDIYDTDPVLLKLNEEANILAIEIKVWKKQLEQLQSSRKYN